MSYLGGNNFLGFKYVGLVDFLVSFLFHWLLETAQKIYQTNIFEARRMLTPKIDHFKKYVFFGM